MESLNQETQKKIFMDAYEEYSDALFRHCYYRVSNQEEAVDLVQDAFVKTWQYMQEGNTVSNLRAFLYSVLNNKIIDYYRKKKSSSLDQLHESGFNPQDHEGVEKIVYGAEVSQITKILDKLQDNYREVIVMRYIDGLSPKEIADITEEKENTISVRLNRAINKMKEILEL